MWKKESICEQAIRNDDLYVYIFSNFIMVYKYVSPLLKNIKKIVILHKSEVLN